MGGGGLVPDQTFSQKTTPVCLYFYSIQNHYIWWAVHLTMYKHTINSRDYYWKNFSFWSDKLLIISPNKKWQLYHSFFKPVGAGESFETNLPWHFTFRVFFKAKLLKGSVLEKSLRVMIPSTCPYRRKIRKKVTPETFNMRKFRFFAQTGYSWKLEQRNLTTDLFCNIFKGFAALTIQPFSILYLGQKQQISILAGKIFQVQLSSLFPS